MTDLDKAYGLNGPDASRKLYAEWAATYDRGFAEANDYILHIHVAHAYAASGAQGPVLDVGAGTGLCGVALTAAGVGPVDATDISPEMLAVAAEKQIYRTLFEGDILAGLATQSGAYAGVVSSGTFTTGHVGPEAIDELLRVVRVGGLVVISINGAHFEEAGFKDKLAQLSDQVTDLKLTEKRFYGDAANGPHKGDKGFIASFRKR